METIETRIAAAAYARFGIVAEDDALVAFAQWAASELGNPLADALRKELADVTFEKARLQAELISTTKINAGPMNEIPAVLYDGHAVYHEVMAHDPHTPRPTADNVSDVLSAVVRLMRRDQRSMQAPQPAGDDTQFLSAFFHQLIHGDFLADNPEDLRKALRARDLMLAQQPAQAAVVPEGGWVVRERRDETGELLDCFVEAPREGKMAYALEVLGDDYTGYGDVARKLEHCKLIVSLVNAAMQAQQAGKAGA